MAICTGLSPTRTANVMLSIAILMFIYLAFRYSHGEFVPFLTRSEETHIESPTRLNMHSQPHIVFFLADDYGFNDIGFRNPAMKTPNLDALAAAGVKLDNYYVQPICTPSRAQLMSGKYQIHTGLQHSLIWPAQPNCLPLGIPTLAEKLREAGYATHMTGKWHLGFYKRECWPTNRGFQSFLGMLLGGGDHFSHTCNNSGFQNGLDFRDGITSVQESYAGKYTTHVIARRAEDVIKQHNPQKPLFLYVSFQAVHTPLQVPKEYMEPFETINDSKRKTYAGMVLCMDEAVGNITAALRNLGLWDNTVLIFSSDNGGRVTEGGNNWPLRGSKTTLWEGGIRAVGFVTSPLLSDRVKGTVSRELIDISDWFPTLIEGVARGSLNGTKLDGHNMWETIKNGRPSPRIEILHNIDPLITPPSGWSEKPIIGDLQRFSTSTYAALRYRDWKIVTGYQEINYGWYAPPESSNESIPYTIPPGKSVWLFNIKDDPNEYWDMSDQRPDIVEFFLRRLKIYQDGAVPVHYPDMDPDANPALHDGLWDSWR